MSDYISNDKNYAIFFNSVYGNDNCPLFERYTGQLKNTVCLFDKEVGVKAHVNQYEGLRRYYQQRNMFEPDSVPIGGNSESDGIDVYNVEELQRLSSSLIHLLKETSEKTLKVKASCGTSQRPHLKQRIKHQDGPGLTRCHRAEKHSAGQLNSGLVTVVTEQDDCLSHPEDNVRIGSTAKTSCHNIVPPNCLRSSADKTSVTTEVLRNGFSASSPDRPGKDTQKEKDRKKKESHNKIEKRRRSIINERITELGNLLPEHIDRVSCQKKGSILKNSIDYIKKLRKDQDRLHQLEGKMSETYDEVKTLANRLEQLEFRITHQLANSGGTDQLQDRTSEKTNINNCLTPATDRQHYVPTSQEPQPDMLTTVSDILAFDEVLDDLSATLSVDSAKSLPGSSRMDIDVMDYYI